jgi:hypothetical protein
VLFSTFAEILGLTPTWAEAHSRKRQARQKGVNTLKGPPEPVFTSHGSKSNPPLKLQTLIPRSARLAFSDVSRLME